MKRKRLQVYALLAVCLTIIIAGFLSMARDIAARPVAYGVERITPLVTDLCPGDVMEYPLTVDVLDVPAVVTIAEAWCQVGPNGVCATSLARSYTVPLLDYRHIETIARREVPRSPFFVPGDEYEFWHGAQGDGGYIVGPFAIRTDCAEGGSGGN